MKVEGGEREAEGRRQRKEGEKEGTGTHRVGRGGGGGRKGRTVHLGGLVEHGHINCTSKESTSTYYILCQHGKVDV